MLKIGATPHMPKCMQFLLFGALQHGSTLYKFSSLLTRRAAIILDDTPVAWGELEMALLLHVEPAKRISVWDNSIWRETVGFDHYMDALARHGAEVESEPKEELDGELKKHYRLVPTCASLLAAAATSMDG